MHLIALNNWNCPGGFLNRVTVCYSEHCSIRGGFPASFWALLHQPVRQPERIHRPARPIRWTQFWKGKHSLSARHSRFTTLGVDTGCSLPAWQSVHCIVMRFRGKGSPTEAGSLLSCPLSLMRRLIRMWMTSPVMTSSWHRYTLWLPLCPYLFDLFENKSHYTLLFLLPVYYNLPIENIHVYIVYI